MRIRVTPSFSATLGLLILLGGNFVEAAPISGQLSSRVRLADAETPLTTSNLNPSDLIVTRTIFSPLERRSDEGFEEHVQRLGADSEYRKTKVTEMVDKIHATNGELETIKRKAPGISRVFSGARQKKYDAARRNALLIHGRQLNEIETFLNTLSPEHRETTRGLFNLKWPGGLGELPLGRI